MPWRGRRRRPACSNTWDSIAISRMPRIIMHNNKKLSCRRETARMDISLSYSTPHHNILSGLPWRSVATNSAEANFSGGPLRLPAVMGRKGGARIQMWVMRGYCHYSGSTRCVVCVCEGEGDWRACACRRTSGRGKIWKVSSHTITLDTVMQNAVILRWKLVFRFAYG